MTRNDAPWAPAPIGPRWEYVSATGARFVAFDGLNVAILQLAARL